MSSDANTIERKAADWLVRAEAGLSPADEANLAAWLEADRSHANAFRALQRSWSRLDQLRGSAVAERLEQEVAEASRPWTARSSVDYTPEARAANGWDTRAPWTPWLSGALAASLVWGAVYFAWWRPAQIGASFAETVATDIGAMRTIALPDGSTMQLNTNTAVKVQFTKTERRVRLGRGEALFKIAKHPARPFIVSVAGVDVRAVGTEFNVRLHGDALEVIVREGKVRVDNSADGATLLAASATPSPAGVTDRKASPPVLAAGQRVVIPVMARPQIAAAPVTPTPLAPVEIERSLAWQNGRLVFESEPLASIVAEFNRYHHRQIVLADPEIAQRRFGGTFVASDPDTFVELLRATNDIAVEIRRGEIVLRAPR